jgi:hypothetical protein
MQILFEATRVNCKHGKSVTYVTKLHAGHGAHTRLMGTYSKRHYSVPAAFISNLLQPPDDPFPNY